jgi:hypothetical protein
MMETRGMNHIVDDEHQGLNRVGTLWMVLPIIVEQIDKATEGKTVWFPPVPPAPPVSMITGFSHY